MSDVFSFRTSTAHASSRDIRTVMEDIRSTIWDIHSDVLALRPDWEGSESDLYDTASRERRKAAHEVNNILKDVAHVLDEVDKGNTMMRDEIQKALDEMK